jgi:hypothetical protein
MDDWRDHDNATSMPSLKLNDSLPIPCLTNHTCALYSQDIVKETPSAALEIARIFTASIAT